MTLSDETKDKLITALFVLIVGGILFISLLIPNLEHREKVNDCKARTDCSKYTCFMNLTSKIDTMILHELKYQTCIMEAKPK